MRPRLIRESIPSVIRPIKPAVVTVSDVTPADQKTETDTSSDEATENPTPLDSDPQILAQQVAYARADKAPAASRTIRVGLSTKGGDIAFWSQSQMLVSDAAQIGRRLQVPARQQVTVSFGAIQTRNANGAVLRGPVQIRLNSGVYGAWQKPVFWVAGGPTGVATDGSNPRYGRAYRGSFEIAPQTFSFEPATHKSPLRLVNLVTLEDYLRGVVPWEMTPTAPLEALKAQAICARSEAMAKILGGRHALDGYQICDYDHCQGYAGTENEKPASDRAVAETAGILMYSEGHIADAVYGTNSGGITADKRDVWRGGPEPHLQSVHDYSPAKHRAIARLVKARMNEADWLQYCSQNLPSYAQPSAEEVAALAARRRKSARTAELFQENDLPEFYRWTRTVGAADLGLAMAAKAPPGTPPMQTATGILVVDRAASGHIKKLAISGKSADGKPVVVVVEKDSQIRSMLSGRLGSTTALPSSTFVPVARRDGSGNVSWVFKGAGWGHGAGMCQRGAQNHALEGWDARQIIAFYYHGVELRKLQ